MSLEALAARMVPSAFTPIHNPLPRSGGVRRFPTISMQKDFAVHSDRGAVASQIERKDEKVEEKTSDQRLDWTSGDGDQLLQDWQMFCKTQPLPELVRMNMEKIKALEVEFGEELHFGGPRGSLKGRPGVEEDHRHREFYGTLSDSESKLQNFTARQVACRVIGSKGYLCETCWLPQRDCMCGTFEKGDLWPGVCLWIYMHPKDFLRKNNTGKLLWQVFGERASRFAVCGIPDQEEVMWNVFKEAGREKVWCIYPHPPECQVPDVIITDDVCSMKNGDEVREADKIHFVLIDGTWSNSKAMISRLKERASALWGGNSMPCVALSPTNVSAMHNLRPQPSTERTCTAAAAAQLLRELSIRSEHTGLGLEHAADLLDDSLAGLQDALVCRRKRVGRTTQRFGRIKCDPIEQKDSVNSY